MIQGTKISFYLPLLKGSFSSWIWNCLGIPVGSHLFVFIGLVDEEIKYGTKKGKKVVTLIFCLSAYL